MICSSICSFSKDPVVSLQMVPDYMFTDMQQYAQHGRKIATAPKSQWKPLRRPLTEQDIIRRILLFKGNEVTPSMICMNVNGRWKSDDIGKVMQSLSKLGIGRYFQKGPLSPRTVFIKKPGLEIVLYLKQQGIPLSFYTNRYNMLPVQTGHRL